MRSGKLACAGVIVVGGLASSAWSQARIETLGLGRRAQPSAITPDGTTIVGWADGTRAFRWSSQTGMVILPLAAGTNSAIARGVSADGSVIVGSDFAATPQYAWVWTPGAGTVLISPPGYDHSWFSAVTADGSLAGGTATISNRTHGFLWSISGHTASLLPDPFPTGNSALSSMSQDGAFVAGSCGYAIRWGPGNGVASLGDAGLGTSLATGISPGGTAVVGQAGYYPNGVAFLWTPAGQGQNLGNPPLPLYGSGLVAVNDAGTFAVGYANNHAGDIRGVVWRPGLGVVDANGYLAARGVDLSEWEVGGLQGMTPDGRILIGSGMHYPAGPVEAFVIHLGPCGIADFNNDGDSGTDADIEAFFACLAGNCCATCESADFNGDGDTGTDADIEAFFRVLAGQPC